MTKEAATEAEAEQIIRRSATSRRAASFAGSEIDTSGAVGKALCRFIYFRNPRIVFEIGKSVV